MKITKIVGAVCGSLLILLLAKWGAEIIYHSDGGHGEEHAEQGYLIETESGGEETAAAEEGPSFEEIYAAADAAKGEKVFNKCKACHKLEDGANATGPTLFAIIDRPVDSVAGFGYSGALIKVADVWSPENLNHFLENPKGFAPGTAMSFSGLKKVEDRANLIAFLAQHGG